MQNYLNFYIFDPALTNFPRELSWHMLGQLVKHFSPLLEIKNIEEYEEQEINA